MEARERPLMAGLRMINLTETSIDTLNSSAGRLHCIDPEFMDKLIDNIENLNLAEHSPLEPEFAELVGKAEAKALQKRNIDSICEMLIFLCKNCGKTVKLILWKDLALAICSNSDRKYPSQCLFYHSTYIRIL